MHHPDSVDSGSDGPPALAQDQTPVFRAESTLVEFTLIAIDKDGNPVTDLKKEEIVVKDKGLPRDLAVFRYEGGEPPRIAPPKLPTGIFTNSPDLTPGAAAQRHRHRTRHPQYPAA